MPKDRLRRADRGVSTTLSYVLALAMTAILISGIFLAAGSLMADQRDAVATEELDGLGQRLAEGIEDADRIADTNEDGKVRVRVWLPRRIAGGFYTVELVEKSTAAAQPHETVIVMRSDNYDLAVNTTLHTSFPIAERTFKGGPVVITHKDVSGDSTRELVVNRTDSIDVGNITTPTPTPIPVDEYVEDIVVFQNSSDLNVSSVGPDGNVIRYNVSDATAFGAPKADFDGDGYLDIPMVHNGSIKLIDANDDEPRVLGGNPRTTKTRVAVGTWNGSELSVFYANDSNSRIYRIAPDGTNVEVAKSTTYSASTVVGFADIDDDGDRELIYLGTSATIKYIEPNGEQVSTGYSVGSNKEAVGQPADFNGDGTPRVPVVTGSNNVALINDEGEIEKVFTDGGADKTGVGVADIDSDGQLEIAYIDKDQKLRYTEYDGTKYYLVTASGEQIVVDPSPGVA